MSSGNVALAASLVQEEEPPRNSENNVNGPFYPAVKAFDKLQGEMTFEEVVSSYHHIWHIFYY